MFSWDAHMLSKVSAIYINAGTDYFSSQHDLTIFPKAK